MDENVSGLKGRAARSRRTNGIVLSFFLSWRSWLIEKSPAVGFRLWLFAQMLWRPVPAPRSRMRVSFCCSFMNCSTFGHGFFLVASKCSAILLYVFLSAL